MIYLLDINVLIALFDPAHVHHNAAHRWFAAGPNNSWATCPITENGFARIVSNPSYPTVSVTPNEATERLRIFCGEPGHVFWPDVVSLTDATIFDTALVSNHQQITDIYLAGLASHYGGKLATFDTSIRLAPLRGAQDVLETIAAS